ncbi:hypothetical protein G4B88_002700 [Cannabis sativa]|uniref:PIN-like protein n=1 Tax=Cannabis sativa TaxID=3483 RepID=A0A7J6DJ16_CANSA|nr:hypothetical protein G4B88_002700 [Cannabis sativa]
MGFWNMLEVASMPILEVLIVSLIGAFLASHYSNLLPLHMLSSLNKRLKVRVVWYRWFMPLNILLTFVIGGILGWIVVKITRPKPHLEGLIIATCSAGNLGNLVIIIVPAICNETGTPFGDTNKCRSAALSYASFSMAELEHISSLSSGSRVGQILHMIREELLAPPTIAVFTLPPAMNISTMTQLFNVAQEECSLLFLWTYLLAAPALTIWSTIYISILSHH